MAALASAAEIPPGGEGAIKASVSTRGRRGNLRKTVTVETSDPEHRTIRLKLQAKVVVEAELDPHYFNFGRMDRGEKASQTAFLEARDPSVKLTKVEWIGDTPDAKAKIVTKDGRQGVRVDFAAKEIGLIRRRLKVHTSSEKIPDFNVMVRAQVLGDWEISSRTVSFPEPGEDVEERHQKRTIRLTARNKNPYKVIKVVDSSDAVASRIEKTQKGYEIELTLEKVPERRRGTIEIVTNDPDEGSFKVRYFVRKLRSRGIPPRPIHRPLVPQALRHRERANSPPPENE